MSSVFVGIACLDDPDIIDTVHSLRENATGLDVRVSVCLQTNVTKLREDVAALGVRASFFTMAESRGACWARSWAQAAYNGEDYYLQTDAHCRFAPGWDLYLKKLSDDLGGAVLTQQAAAIASDGSLCREEVAGMYLNGCGPLGPYGQARPIGMYLGGREAIPARFICAAMVFAPGRYVLDVPMDPGMYFGGDEMGVALRAFTAGYDLYHPAQIIVWHRYANPWRLDKAIHEHANTREMVDREFEHMKVLWGLQEGNLGIYGRGSKRSLNEWEEWSELSWRTPIKNEDKTWKQWLRSRRSVAGPQRVW